MRLMRVIIAGCLVICAQAALAGPWPRAEGETFLSYSVETEFESGITDGSGLYGSLYAEHGLTDRLTLGLDAGGHEDDLAKAIVFLRWPVGAEDRSIRMAGEFGLGLARGDFALRPGFSIGRGIELGTRPGWISLDSRAIFGVGFDGALETDLTFGLTTSPRSKVVLQVQTGMPWGGDPFAKIAPTYVHRIGRDRHLEIGFVAGVSEADDMKIKIGLWHRF